jgi:hypothetical protein
MLSYHPHGVHYRKIRKREAGYQRFTPIILATQEAEIRRIMVRSQPGQIVHETLSRKILHKNRAGEREKTNNIQK